MNEVSVYLGYVYLPFRHLGAPQQDSLLRFLQKFCY
jgi:hypothetical protein